MRGEHEGDLWRLAALLAETLEGETHGVRMRHIALQRLEDGGLQIGGVGAIQQPYQGGGDGAQIGARSAARSRRRSRLGRGRNSCRSQPGRDNPRKETVEPAARHGVRTRKRQVDERHDCQDNAPACVPSTVWGTASRRNSQVGLGAVLALDNEQALIPPSAPRQPKPAPKGQAAG